MSPFTQASMLRCAADVRRYHTQRTLTTQTVGMHSFGVAMLAQQVDPNCRKEVILAAMHHDLPELLTGDVPAPAKRMCPELAVALERVEQRAGVLHYDPGLTVYEQRLLKWCDLMELVLFSLEEIGMGNTFMAPVLRNGVEWLWDMRCPTKTARTLLAEITAKVTNGDHGMQMSAEPEWQKTVVNPL